MVYFSWVLAVIGFLAWYVGFHMVPDFQDWMLSSHPYSNLFDCVLLMVLKYWGVGLILAAGTGFVLNYANPAGFQKEQVRKTKLVSVVGLFVAVAISGTILAFIPHDLSVSVSGPSLIYDKSPSTVTFSSTVSGGASPLSYQWTISMNVGSDVQEYVSSSTHNTAISVTFSANTSQFYNYGRNVTYSIELTVTDINNFQNSSIMVVQVEDP